MYADDTTIRCNSDYEIAPKLTCYKEAAKDYFLDIQFHILCHRSGRVPGVPAGSKSGHVRCFGADLNIAIPIRWAK